MNLGKKHRKRTGATSRGRSAKSEADPRNNLMKTQPSSDGGEFISIVAVVFGGPIFAAPKSSAILYERGLSIDGPFWPRL
jgi:hypothetical protein